MRVVAISNDPVDVNREHRRTQGFTFPLLSDENTQVARRYDLLHAGGGSGGADIARPAEFLIDPTGTVRWVNLTGSVTVRARPDQVLAALDAAGIR